MSERIYRMTDEEWTKLFRQMGADDAEPHEIEAAGNGPIDESRWLSDEHVKREIYKPSYRSTYILYLLLGVAALIGIVIGALS